MIQFKRWFSYLLVFCMAISVMPITAHASESGACGENLIWSLNDDGVLTISGSGDMDEFGYSEEYGNFSYAPWYYTEGPITKVIIEDGVTSIGQLAFYGCFYCTEIMIPTSVISIGANAFSYCSGMTEVSIPDSVTSIGEKAFEFCSSLTSVTIPNSVTNIGAGTFQGCSSMTDVIVSEDNPNYCNDNYGVLLNKNKSSLMQVPGGFSGHYSIPNSITTIENMAFSGCSGLTSVAIPDSVTYIGENAFYRCTSLSSITIPSSVAFIGHVPFSECTGLSEIRFEGDLPFLASPRIFYGITATVYYPGNNATWTSEVMQACDGNVTWVPYEVAETPEEPAIRISGSGRSQTALAAADLLQEKLGVEKFDTVILSSGKDFADALAGSYLANAKSAPILLYYNNTSIAENVAYIQSNLTSGGKVYILGGTAAVPEAVETALAEAGIAAERLQGSNRFDTNMQILNAAGVGDKEILICTGWNYADCLAASATGLPIMMLNTNRNVLTEDQINFLTNNKDNKFTIIGGTGAVSETLEDTIEAIVGEIDRVYGNCREETSVAVAERYFTNPEYAFVAYSRNFPDGLCGGPVAYAHGAPLLLVNKNQERYAAAYIRENGIDKGYVMGGTAVVSDDIVYTVFALSE